MFTFIASSNFIHVYVDKKLDEIVQKKWLIDNGK